jgi:outer membrane cobalamin receptor
MLSTLVILLPGSVLGNSKKSKSQTVNTIEKLEPIVVTGTFSPVSLTQSIASATVIDRRQIEASQATSVTELLRHVPGLHIDQPGGRGGVSSVYMRGGDPNYTVVLMDGVKVNDPNNSRGGSFDFSTLNTDNIEKIEIIQGPLSSVYGSDAMSGVINIITRKGGEKPFVDVEADGGRFGYARTLVRTGGVIGKWDYSLSGSYLDNGEPVEGSSLVNKTFMANLGGALSDSMGLRTVMRFADSDNETFPDDSGGPLFATRRDTDQRDITEFSLGIQFNHEPLPIWGYQFEVEMLDRKEDQVSPGVAPGIRDSFGIPVNSTDNSFQRYGITLTNQFQLTEQSKLTLGLEGVYEEGSSRGSIELGGPPTPTQFDLDRKILAPFFEFQHAFQNGFSLLAGVRWDFPNEFKSEVSPRIGTSYTTESTGTTLKANWGEGFKLPAFFSLGNSLVGNPGLGPETNWSVDAGITQSFWNDRAILVATYFHTTFSNAIDFDEGPPPILVNRSEVVADGIELSLSVDPMPKLSWKGQLTYVETDIKGTSEKLRSRPKWRGGFSLLWRPIPELMVNLNSVTVGEVFDSSVPTGDLDLAPYTRLDLAVTWEAKPTWRFLFAIDNLMDEKYEEFVGFPAPGISPRIGLRKTFGLGS